MAAQFAGDALWDASWEEGAGEQTVKKRQLGSSGVQLFTSWFCPFAQRAWIALEEKGIDYAYIEINPYEVDAAAAGGYSKKQLPLDTKAQLYPAFVEASHAGLVPAVRCGEDGVCESSAVVEYVDEKFPGPWLLPRTAGERAYCRTWALHFDAKVQRPYYLCLMEQNPQAAEKHRDSMIDGLRTFAAAMLLLTTGGPFFLGPIFSFVEIMCAPFWMQISTVGAHYRPKILSKEALFEKFQGPDFDRLEKWWQATLARPSVAATIVCIPRLIASYANNAHGTATSDYAKRSLASALTATSKKTFLQDLKIVVVGGSIAGLATAAFLAQKGARNVRVLEKNAENCEDGAGVGLDEISMTLLRTLGSETIGVETSLYEERTASGLLVMEHQPLPYYSALYGDLRRVLAKGVKVEHGTRVDDISRIDADLIIGADGPRSMCRGALDPNGKLRFAGYCAWRGLVSLAALAPEAVAELKEHYVDLGNCLYFVHEDKLDGPREHAVVYDVGGRLNWLVYENCEPYGNGTTTTRPSIDEVKKFREKSKKWGGPLAALIQATQQPFRTDVYDLENPLRTFSNGHLVLVGDAAHACTPHLAKGSNMAIQDAFSLAHSLATSDSIKEALAKYDAERVAETRRILLLSRHYGKVRNNLLNTEEGTFEARLQCGLPLHCLSATPLFAGICAKVEEQGFLTRFPLLLDGADHIALETRDVARLAQFYAEVLGLERLERPSFEFDGAWFNISSTLRLHIIQADDARPLPKKEDEKFIRRARHVALVLRESAEAAGGKLTRRGIAFAENKVPGTQTVQLFFYDPDGNGIELLATKNV